MERTPLQRETRLRSALKNALGAWVADTAGENGSNDVYLEAEAAIAESEAATLFAITADQLRQVMPNLPASRLSAYRPFLNAAMQKYEINTPLRAAAFLAQLAHESGEFKYFEEIWGPTLAQRGYEGRKDLGNTQPGDGRRYRGRGPIQITGRANYKRYGDILGVDFVNNPDLAAKPEWAFVTAALYWKMNRCNELADVQDFRAITRAINGGLTGLAERERYYAMAKNALEGK